MSATKKGATKTVEGRLLRQSIIAGALLQANTVVVLSEKDAKLRSQDGEIDIHPDAVAYCRELGTEIWVHPDVTVGDASAPAPAPIQDPAEERPQAPAAAPGAEA